MADLLIATGNPGKFREISSLLSDVPYTLRSLTDFGLSGDFEEVGDTFEAIARQKATHFARLSNTLTLAEDSGIFVDALPGELGVYTRRWGHGTTDEEWITYFLHRMKRVPNSKRTARFVCAACVLFDGIPFLFIGQTRGFITHDLQAPIQKGLPLSSCFIPEGHKKVYAALSVGEKAYVSHRGKAIVAVKSFLLQKA